MSTTTTEHPVTITALDYLVRMHPGHGETIGAHVRNAQAGTIVRYEEAPGSTGGGRFWTGVGDGDLAIVSRTDPRSGNAMTVQHVTDPGAHLHVNMHDTLTSIDPAEWTREQAKAAQRTAEAAAADAQKEALADVTGWGALGGTPRGTDRGVAALWKAHGLLHFAFACGVYADYIEVAERAAKDPRFAAVRRANYVAGAPTY